VLASAARMAGVKLKRDIRGLLRALGYDVVRYEPASHPIARRGLLVRHYAIDTVLDVGANEGQFAEELRNEVRFGGRICSFEPLSTAFARLQARAARDPSWDVFRVALGDEPGTATLNVAGNSQSSSLLAMLPEHVAAAPASSYVGTEEVTVDVLDAVFDDLCAPGHRVLLKIDTQGYEGRVLAGARDSLTRIQLVQLEMPLRPLYAGELSFVELHQRMREDGFRLVALEPTFCDPRTGELLQVDGVFDRP
jgi:FkbM family methyltransferase